VANRHIPSANDRPLKNLFFAATTTAATAHFKSGGKTIYARFGIYSLTAVFSSF
jgi:hypothetical protein